MKPLKFVCGMFVSFGLLGGTARAIPQTFGNGFLGVRANGEDFTDEFLIAANWEANQLPGDWVDDAALEGMQLRRMTANPVLFGVVPMFVRSVSDGSDRLEAIEVTYLDAGAFFGYRPGGQEAVAAAQESVRERQRQFGEIYGRFHGELTRRLESAGGGPGHEVSVGRTQFLRGQSVDFVHSGFLLRYQAVGDHSIRLTIMREGDARDDYLDKAVVGMDREARAAWFGSKVRRGGSGDVEISGVPVFRQGERPYCAISTLGMVTHYLGLRLSVDGLAAAAGFQNDGTAGGTKLLELYAASAQEAGLRSSRGGKFEFERAKRSLEAGFPVLVWRKYDAKRDLLHTEFAKFHLDEPGAELPEPDARERSTWPGSDAPNHASVVTGFNEARGEVIFMESWGEHTRGRRMRLEELEATSYMAFYYKL